MFKSKSMKNDFYSRTLIWRSVNSSDITHNSGEQAGAVLTKLNQFNMKETFEFTNQPAITFFAIKRRI